MEAILGEAAGRRIEDLLPTRFLVFFTNFGWYRALLQKVSKATKWFLSNHVMQEFVKGFTPFSRYLGYKELLVDDSIFLV